MELFIFTLELIGTVAFAVSGAMVGVKKHMDIFGVMTLGLITAVGGGMIRDLILGITPPSVFFDPTYAVCAVIASVVVFCSFTRRFLIRFQLVYERLMLILDSIGLGIFTVVGVQIAASQSREYTDFLLVFVGVITGIGGGMLRDILAGEIPSVLSKKIYACASLAGALVCALCRNIWGMYAAMLVGAATVLVIRLLAAKLRWHLPKANDII